MMNPNRKGIADQLRRNTVALISLVVAISSLSYNSWRNEKNEENHTRRVAAFEVLLKLGQIQQLVFHLHYDQDDSDQGNPRTGWAYVMVVHDLSTLLGPSVMDAADELLSRWAQHWEGLGTEQSSADEILLCIDDFRDRILGLLKSLE